MCPVLQEFWLNSIVQGTLQVATRATILETWGLLHKFCNASRGFNTIFWHSHRRLLKWRNGTALQNQPRTSMGDAGLGCYDQMPEIFGYFSTVISSSHYPQPPSGFLLLNSLAIEPHSRLQGMGDRKRAIFKALVQMGEWNQKRRADCVRLQT